MIDCYDSRHDSLRETGQDGSIPMVLKGSPSVPSKGRYNSDESVKSCPFFDLDWRGESGFASVKWRVCSNSFIAKTSGENSRHFLEGATVGSP
jgi:hypothetical protein